MATTTTTDAHDDYWKLQLCTDLTGKEMRTWLATRNFNVGSTTDTAELREYVRRADLGIRSYRTCSNDELRKIITARKIDASHYINKRNVGSRQELLILLDKADLRPKFYRFLDLPAELRNRIYEYHIAGFRQPVYAPSQPPITKICNQVREEVLPMFYASCELEIRMHYSKPASGRARLAMSDRMLLFLQSLDHQSIAPLRKLRIVVEGLRPARTRYLLYRLQWDDDEYELQRGEIIGALMHMVVPYRNLAANAERMGKRMRDVAHRVAARGRKERLRRGDFFEIRRVLEAGLL